MKILLIHYRYSILGGPERYLFNIKELLEKNGHEVIPFSIEYANNIESSYSSYFVKPASPEFHMHKIPKFSFTAIKTGVELVYNKSAYQNLNNLINDTKPDIAYILKFSKLSISILKSLREQHIPTILRISDFSYFCSRGVFMMNAEICEKCLDHSFHRILNKCTNDSYLLSTIDYARRIIETKIGYLKYVDELVIPSIFTANYYKKYSYFPNARISHIPTFADSCLTSDIYNEKSFNKRFLNKSITLFGRVSIEKGMEVFLKSITKLFDENQYNFSINIVGFTDSDYSNSLKKSIIESKIPNINCFEFQETNELNRLLDNTTFAVIPSICYDNMPNSLIESQAIGLPVIASNIGSFPELIENNCNGFLFATNDYISLADIIKKAFKLDKNKYIEMSKNSFNWANDYCSEEKHYTQLMAIFNRYVN